MKILAAVGIVVISISVIAMQLAGWFQTQPKTVNLAATSTRLVGGPLEETSAAGPNNPGTPGAAPQAQDTITHMTRVDVRQTSRFIWPATGTLSSYFGAYHVLGIDIALRNDEETPIVAAAPGTVEFAGGSACCEYGLYVIVKHEGDLSTLYAHLSKLEVIEGDEVAQGQLLGYGGSTGVSDGKHLHFELRNGDTLVDPLRYLPSAVLPGPRPVLRADCSNDFLRVDPGSRVEIVFPEAAGYRPVNARFDDETTAAGWFAGIEGQGGLTHRVVADIPPAPSARGLIRDANLSIMLSDGPNLRTVECGLRLATVPTQANAPRITRHPGTTARPPTPTPTATPVLRRLPPAAPTAAAPAVDRPAAAPPRQATPPPRPGPTQKPAQTFPITR